MKKMSFCVSTPPKKFTLNLIYDDANGLTTRRKKLRYTTRVRETRVCPTGAELLLEQYYKQILATASEVADHHGNLLS
jgi:hypothetical protein